MIRRFGGSHGIRDVGLLESATFRPQSTFGGEDLYKGMFLKAAALLQSLLMNHPFLDGNKRTALASTGIFLRMNMYELINKHEEEVSFAVRVDNDHLSIDEIASWLKKNSKKLSI